MITKIELKETHAGLVLLSTYEGSDVHETWCIKEPLTMIQLRVMRNYPDIPVEVIINKDR